MRPSLREVAVHDSLQKTHHKFQKQTTHPQPLLFGVFTVDSLVESAANIHSLDYRFMTMDCPTGLLKPIPLEITNLVHSSEEEYRAFTPLAPFSFGTSPDLKQLTNRIPTQIKELETFFESRLAQVKVKYNLCWLLKAS